MVPIRYIQGLVGLYLYLNSQTQGYVHDNTN